MHACRYSSPSLGVGPGDRKVLHSVEGGVLFFAGEHTNLYAQVSLQAAMETGRRAANQLSEVFDENEKQSRVED